MNDSHLRAAFPLPETPSTLDAKVDRALARHASLRRIERRVALGFALTATLAVALVAGPAVRAQASVAGIVHALDKQTRVRVTTYSVDEQGRRWPNATTTIANGDLAYVDAKGTRQHYDVGSKSYDLDPTIGRFVVSARRPGGSIRLSDMLSGASGFSLGKRAEVRRVDGVLQATILNNDLPERYVIDADLRTELPLRMHVDSLERGAWRLRSELAFDYDLTLTALRPDFVRYPLATRSEADSDFEKAMSGSELASVPLREGRLVVRRLDVAQDGTVYVAFQTGDRLPRSWRGYTFSLTDNLGTKYDGSAQIFTAMDGPFRLPDGRLEMEVFVPLSPLAPNDSRVLNLTINQGKRGRFARFGTVNAVYPDGHVEERRFPNSEAITSIQTGAPVLRQRVAGATCGIFPAWAVRLDPFGNNPVAAEMSKSEARARAAIQAKDWSEAEVQLNEVMRLKSEHERQGYGPYRQDDTVTELDKVHAAMRGEPWREEP